MSLARASWIADDDEILARPAQQFAAAIVRAAIDSGRCALAVTAVARAAIGHSGEAMLLREDMTEEIEGGAQAWAEDHQVGVWRGLRPLSRPKDVANHIPR